MRATSIGSAGCIRRVLTVLEQWNKQTDGPAAGIKSQATLAKDMGKLNMANDATGDSTKQQSTPSEQANTFHIGAENDFGDKFSHLSEQDQQQQQQRASDLSRRDYLHKFPVEHDAVGSVGSQTRQSPQKLCLNKSPERWCEPTRPESASPDGGGKLFEWAHSFGYGLKSNNSANPSDCNHETQPQGPPSRSPLNQLKKMIKSHYLATIVCLILVIVACVMASVAISRTIGEQDLETDTTKEPSGRRLSQTLVDPLELRTIELVDLMASGKTFAYARWRVQVMVPKSSAPYKQRPIFIVDHNQNDTASMGTEKSPESTGSGANRLMLSISPTPTSNNDGFQLGKAEASVAQPRTLENLAGSSIPNQSANTNSASSQRQRRNSNASLADAAERLSLVMDPFEMAAIQMSVSVDDMNSTLIDCFLVDVEKRLDQKQSVEARHVAEASTRQVNFKHMLALIQACRSLTMTSLLSSETIRDKLAKVEDTSRPFKRLTNTIQASAPRDEGDARPPYLPPLVAGMSRQQSDGRRQISVLDESIVPVVPPERQRLIATAPSAPAVGDNPFESLLDSLFASLASPRASANDLSTRKDAAASNVAKSKRGAPTPSASSPVSPAQAEPKAKPAVLVSSNIEPASPDDEARRASYVSMGMSMMSGIVPNTLWCGLGDRAQNYSELGSEYQVDACCRAHDHCPIRLKPFAADYQLINWSMSTRSHCDCDLDFNDCLAALNSTLSNVIRTLYFRFVGLQCINLDGRSERPLLGQAGSDSQTTQMVT